MARFFLPQSTLEEWVASDLADLRGTELVLTKEKSTFPVAAAVHFVKVVSGSDENKLLSKVKTQAQLESLHPELIADSAIVGETAYEIVSGYIADAADIQSAKAKGDADLLAAFILDKM
jgi:hypothetical protein